MTKAFIAAALLAVPTTSFGQSFDGPYVGIQAGVSDIETNSALEGDGNSLGIFAGYNFNVDGIVYGIEVDYDETEYELGDGAVEVDSTTRLKGRIGTNVGGGLLYGTLGVVGATSPELGDDNGYLYGAGFDFPVSSNITLGAELLQHEFEEYNDTDNDVSVTTFKARLGFAF